MSSIIRGRFWGDCKDWRGGRMGTENSSLPKGDELREETGEALEEREKSSLLEKGGRGGTVRGGDRWGIIVVHGHEKISHGEEVINLVL